MKKIGAFCMVLLMILSMIGIPVCAQSVNPNDSVAQNQQQSTTDYGIDSANTLLGSKKIVENVKSAILFEANSETLMYTWNPDTKMFPASFVKLLTAYVAIKHGNLEDLVTVNQSAVSSVPHDAVSVDLLAGEQMLLKDLLYCLLLGSANDAAVVIAEHISGSEASFAELMNSCAAEIGCKDSHFVNSHGLHNQSQYTTARDSARIIAAAISNEDFYTIFSTTKYTVPATNKSELRNLISGNYLLDPASKLYYDNRVIGGRTGVTEDGRRCLAAVAESNGMRLITIVMGADSVYQEDGTSAISIGGYQETTALLNAGFSGYKTAQILYANQALRQYSILNGDSDLIMGPRESVITILPEKVELANLVFRYADAPLAVPISRGDKVSTLEVWHQTMCVARVELFAMNSVHLKEATTEDLSSEQDSVLMTVLIVVIAIPAFGFLVIFAIRSGAMIKHSIANKRSKRYRRSRRRSR